ncbi:MAG: DUF2905 domain-containing protein [bacterium]
MAPELSQVGRLLIVLGLMLVLFGGIFYFLGRVPGLGRLPGDIYYESDGFSIYFPVTTCILLSVLLSFLIYLFRAFLQ